MSEWPKKYRYIYKDKQYDFIMFEDFEKLLHICAGMISTKSPFDTMHPQDVAKFIIEQIKEDLKNG